jgi:hypothetical protein
VAVPHKKPRGKWNVAFTMNAPYFIIPNSILAV